MYHTLLKITYFIGEQCANSVSLSLSTIVLKHTRLFSFQASGNLGLCFSLDTRTCMSSNVGWFPASA